MARFEVLTVTGWTIYPHADRRAVSRRGSGIACTVYDSAHDRDIATYTSEGHGGMLKHKAHALAERLAREHAARLEAEYGVDDAA